MQEIFQRPPGSVGEIKKGNVNALFPHQRKHSSNYRALLRVQNGFAYSGKMQVSLWFLRR